MNSCSCSCSKGVSSYVSLCCIVLAWLSLLCADRTRSRFCGLALIDDENIAAIAPAVRLVLAIIRFLAFLVLVAVHVLLLVLEIIVLRVHALPVFRVHSRRGGVVIVLELAVFEVVAVESSAPDALEVVARTNR